MKSNTIIIIPVALIVVAMAYWYFFTDTGNQPPLSTSPIESQSQTQFQRLVSELQPISFTTTIFSDPRFLSLIDLATPITAEVSGRVDPFAPVSNASTNASTSIKNE